MSRCSLVPPHGYINEWLTTRTSQSTRTSNMASRNTLSYTLLAVVCILLAGERVAGQQQQQGPVNELCLGCICEAVSGCNRSLGCDRDVCGLFKITWAYWSDAGKPVINQDNPDNEGAYARCVTEPFCAARTVQGYMAKYSKDCNGDGVINCDDYAAIHRLGGYGCNAPLDFAYQSKFQQCQREVASLNQG